MDRCLQRSQKDWKSAIILTQVQDKEKKPQELGQPALKALITHTVPSPWLPFTPQGQVENSDPGYGVLGSD